MKNKGLARDR